MVLIPAAFLTLPLLAVAVLQVLFFVHSPEPEPTCDHPIHMAGFQVAPFPTQQETTLHVNNACTEYIKKAHKM